MTNHHDAMPQKAVRPRPSDSLQDREKAIRILARTIARDLQTQGYETRDLIALATELLGHAATRMREDP
jgi:hypothetical protein